MIRPLVALALLTIPAVASAQFDPPVLGGRAVTGPPIASGGSALFPVRTPVPPRFSVGGGSLGEYPPLLIPSGDWGGVRYPWPVYPVPVEPIPVRAPAAAAVARQIVLSGQANATLVVQLPAAAELWVAGKRVEGSPAPEWTLTSPTLRTGTAHMFELKGRWEADGKTFETSRSVAVTVGDRSRLIVVTGTEIKE